MQAPSSGTARPVICLPTYNERENLCAIIDAILAAQPTFHILVIDDGSPDGTGDLAEDRASEDPRISVLHRSEKAGLGPAYLAGFQWCLAHEASFTHIFEMDADFSHPVEALGRLLSTCEDQGADLAVGSRYVPGGGTEGWPLHRQLISQGGSLYARTVLGVGLRDLTAGFMCYRRHVLEALPLNEVQTLGYGFQIEMKYRCLLQGFRVREVPITFVDRTQGASKMSGNIVREAMASVWKLRFALR